MPKVKVKRKSVALDMTAMCDVAFLLLTFFILTTKFKPNEAVTIITPTSVSEIKLPETDIMVISVANDGKVFFGIDGQHIRPDLLDRMGQVKNVSFTDKEKAQFALMDMIGLPVAAIKSYLALPPDQRDNVTQTGIPADSVNNELKDWIINARYANPKLRIAVKGDVSTNYDKVKAVINTLQEQNINRFNLVTGLEANPNK